MGHPSSSTYHHTGYNRPTPDLQPGSSGILQLMQMDSSYPSSFLTDPTGSPQPGAVLNLWETPHAPVSPRTHLGTYSCSQGGRAASQAQHLLLHAH